MCLFLFFYSLLRCQGFQFVNPQGVLTVEERRNEERVSEFLNGALGILHYIFHIENNPGLLFWWCLQNKTEQLIQLVSNLSLSEDSLCLWQQQDVLLSESGGRVPGGGAALAAGWSLSARWRLRENPSPE